MKGYKKTYTVSEDEILKISWLFGTLEDAIKELIRHSRAHDKIPGTSELHFYESTSRTLYECDHDPEIKAIELDSIF